MSEDKETIVEKRISRGVIRRTVKKEDVPQPNKTQEQKKTISEQKVIAPVIKVQSKQTTTDQPKSEPSIVKRRVHAASSNALENIKKNLKLDEVTAKKNEAEAAAEALQNNIKKTDSEKTTTSEVVKTDEAPKVEAKPKFLSFRDRLKGSIVLDKPKPQQTPAATTSVAKKPEMTAEEEKEVKAKAVKVKKGVKVIGGDLDIEGQGKSVNLQQITRTVHVDRVFRPSPAGSKKKRIVAKKVGKSNVLTERKASKRIVEMHETISVANLAQQLGVKAAEIIKYLMNMGEMVTANQAIDADTVSLIAQEYGYQLRSLSFKEDTLIAGVTENDPDAVPRPPVVTIMGHVDHGKTSLLDAIRSTNVTSSEAGGITQHIGAYTVELPEGKVTFLDTPGHEAFTAIRARGSKVTDIVILVVAADDGVMPQTLESIDHARAAGVPIIVAVNKIDKEGADLERITRQLSEKGLLSEAWGGDTIFVPVSALKKQGIKELLESILLQAEVLELKANQKRKAQGTVIEAKLDKSRGALCTLLVQKGILKLGDFLVAGTTLGKVRAMTDWQGEKVTEAYPSIAVEILGLEGVPNAGDAFDVVDSEQDAKKIIEHRKEQEKNIAQNSGQKLTLEEMFLQAGDSGFKELNLIIKADVQGSLEAVRDSITKLGTDDVKTKVISSGVGGVNESDITLAITSRAVIIGFNVRPETKAIHLAKEKGVDIKLYKIIYDLINDVKLAMQGLLEPTRKETYLGRAEVKQVFAVSKLGYIAGSQVVDGVIARHANIRLLRDNVVLHEGKIASLKRFKDDAKEVKKGFECGIGFEGYKDLKPGDVVEAFEVEFIERTL